MAGTRWLEAELNLETVMILKGSHLVDYQPLLLRPLWQDGLCYYAVTNKSGPVPGIRWEWRKGSHLFKGGLEFSPSGERGPRLLPDKSLKINFINVFYALHYFIFTCSISFFESRP